MAGLCSRLGRVREPLTRERHTLGGVAVGAPRTIAASATLPRSLESPEHRTRTREPKDIHCHVGRPIDGLDGRRTRAATGAIRYYEAARAPRVNLTRSGRGRAVVPARTRTEADDRRQNGETNHTRACDFPGARRWRGQSGGATLTCSWMRTSHRMNPTRRTADAAC